MTRSLGVLRSCRSHAQPEWSVHVDRATVRDGGTAYQREDTAPDATRGPSFERTAVPALNDVAMPRRPPSRTTRASADLGLDRLCIAICHDLRGPVTTAGAAMRGLEQSLPATDAERRRFLDIARRSLARADELLLSLPLLVAREERPRLVPVPLRDLLAGVHAEVEPELHLAEGRLAVRGPLAVVSADPERLRIGFRNLLRNAIQHRRPDVDLEIVVRCWCRGPSCTVTIADNGAGLPRSEQARLRGRLRPGRAATGGLGLAIARGAIEACGGRLGASSRPGVGTVFAITLSAARGVEKRRSSRDDRAAVVFRQRRGAIAPTRP
jgi:signal transduction histidine kinase